MLMFCQAEGVSPDRCIILSVMFPLGLTQLDAYLYRNVKMLLQIIC